MDKFEHEEATPHHGTSPDHVFPHKTNTRNPLIVSGIVAMLLVLGLLMAGVAYLWQVAETRLYEIAEKEEKITMLNQRIAELSDTDASQTTPEANNTIAIRELGISITVPESARDLTYFYSSESVEGRGVVEVVSLSTKELSDEYGELCGANSFALGYLYKVPGKTPAESVNGSEYGTPIRQFDDYFVAYSSPQGVCAPESASKITFIASEFAKSMSAGSVEEL